MIGMLRLRDWYIIAPLGLAAYALGAWGFALGHGACAVSLPQAALQAFGLVIGGRFAASPKCEIPWQVTVAQYSLPLIALVGAAKLFLANLRRDVSVMLAHQARGHVIVCGLGDTGTRIVKLLRDAARTTVAITLDRDDANALACEKLGATVLRADAQQPHVLRTAGIKHADAIIATTGSDAQNLEIGLRAGEMSRRRVNRPLKIAAEMRADWLMDSLRIHRAAVLGGAGTDFQVFNLNINAARSVLGSTAFLRSAVLPVRNPRIVLAGTGAMTVEIARRAICSIFALPGVRPSIFAFGRNAVAPADAHDARWHDLVGLADFDFHTLEFAARGAASWDSVVKALETGRTSAVFVALDEDEDALHTALRFRGELDKHDQFATPVFVRLKQQRKLGEFMTRIEVHPFLPDRLVAFGDLQALTALDILLDPELDRMARAAHAVYLRSRAGLEPGPADVPWARLPERFKSANRDFADFIPTALRACGYRITGGTVSDALDGQAVEMLAGAEHWRWCLTQRSRGWAFGERRDEVLKRTPALVEWSQLPEETRRLNRELAAQIPEIVRETGRRIRAEQVLDARDLSPATLARELAPEKVVILRADPTSPSELATARKAAEMGARIRLAWRGAGALSVLRRYDGADVLERAFDGWLID